MNTERMPVAVKKSPRSHDKFVTYIMLIVSCLNGSTTVTNPTPSASSLGAKAQALAQAQAKARGRGPGLTADRDAKRRDLEEDLDHLVLFVHGAIKALGADAAAATAIILSTGLSVRKTTRPAKPPLAAMRGGVSGEVVIVALAVAHAAMYYWEISGDLKVWTSISQTMQAKTKVSGLTPGQVYFFRLRTHTRKGMGDYSDAVRCMAI